MNIKTFGILIAASTILVVVGCNTTQQRTAYSSIGTVEAGASFAVDGYYALVIKGIVPTNGVPAVSKAFKDLQASAMLAATVSQSGTNALAPANLVTEAANLTQLIITLEGK